MPASFTVLVPEYSTRFRCIGPDCEDDCCHGWAVPIDQTSLDKYRSLPPGPLRSQLDICLQLAQPAPSAEPAASIRMLPSGRCPFHTPERLCRIHQELGHSALSQTCAHFPRRAHRIDGLEQVTLSLACPEAARLVLLEPDLFASPVRRHKLPWNTSVKGSDPLRTFYWPIREFVTALIVERSYALWQRLFLLGVFCRRLDALARAHDRRTFPEFICDFSDAVASGSLRAAMDAAPANPALQRRLIRELIGLSAATVRDGSPFGACLSAFNAAIGSGETASPAAPIASWAAAHATTLEPFLRDHPSMLENYLVNELLHCAFPFGDALFHPDRPIACMAAFAQLAVRFGILQGLLIGVAAARGSAFSAADVVQTVSAVSRHFEHSRTFAQRSSAFLQENNLAGLAGLTALLRH